MGYRRALLLRWSGRDRLAVLVVALAVGFLIGTTLVVTAAGSQTASIAAEFGTPGYVSLHESPQAARAAIGTEALVLPFARVSTPAGEPTYVVARPALDELASELGLGGQGVTVASGTPPAEIALTGAEASVTVNPTARGGESVLPPDWYLAEPTTVTRLGETGALAIDPAAADSGPGSPLRAALEFFLRGTREALTAITVAGVGAGVLVGVTVFGVTRMGVRDRLDAIRVVRSTGGTPATVLGLFALRAGLVTAVGTALGYAIGIILPNAAVSVAIATGQPISLPLPIDARTARSFVPLLLGPVVIGTLAGAAAAYPAASRPPGRIEDSHAPAKRARQFVSSPRLRPRLLDRRLVAPTAATLAAFVVLATVAAGLGAALGPVAGSEGQTVVEPGAPHPFASRVPAAYAEALRAEGIDASGEILLLEVVDGRPFVAFGAEYEHFASVHDTTIVAGRAPAGPREAVIGASLATALDVEPGDRIVLGGSTEERLTVVTVVGEFDAAGAAASQLVVPLETARHLAGVPSGTVHLVSADRLPQVSGDGEAAGVVDVSLPDRAAANTTVPVRITVRNDGLEPATHEVVVEAAGERVREAVEVGSLGTRTITIEVPSGPVGDRTVRVNGERYAYRAVDPSAITIVGLPETAPLDSRPRLRVVTLAGDPVSGATITVGDRNWTTDGNGHARVTFAESGSTTLNATAGNWTATTTVSVEPDAARTLQATITVSPSNPSVLVQPTAHVSLTNPWAVPLNRSLALEGASDRSLGTVHVKPGETFTRDVPLERRAPGSYELTLNADGVTVGVTSYRVTGDDRLAAALASSGRDGGSGLSRAMEAALGNLQLVLAVVVGLAGLMTVGATAATFAAGVQARRRTLGVHRATGASPTQVLRLVLADAVKLGVAATVVAVPIGLLTVYGFAELGLLTILGVRVPPVPQLPVLVGIIVAAVGLTVIGAGLATVGVLRATPGALLRDEGVSRSGGPADD